MRDELVVTKGLLKVEPRSRAVQSESAFALIEEAYQEVKDILPQVASLVP